MSEGLISLAEDLAELNERWQPLDWQIPLGRALFYLGKKDLGAQCGRSSGKTDLAAYCSWRYARENEGSENYIFEPLQKQAKEILWAPQRIQNFGPSDWVESVNNTEMRITFTNGSFIKVDGSDNVEALRGIKPKGLVIYDELKDIKKAFLDAMEPNRARYDAPALYLGTPPEIHNHYIDIMEILKKKARGFWTQANSFDNHYNSKTWLEDKRQELIDIGEEETWLREYMAIFVKGSKRSIFPQFFKMPRPNFKEIIPKDLNKWEIMVAFDPASVSVFGVVFILFNEWTKQTIVFDELYVKDQSIMTAREIYAQVSEKLKPLQKLVKSVRFGYDEAAAWFRNEIHEFSPWWLEPSSKSDFGVDGYIILVRQHFNKGLLTICADCPNLISELEGYQKDEKGKIPKKDDHNINALQYGLSCLGLRLDEDKPPLELDPDLQKRAYSMSDDFDFSGNMTELD